MAEDIIDLTGDDGVTEKPAKPVKQKKEKVPKVPKMSSSADDKSAKKEKKLEAKADKGEKRKGGKLLIILAIVLVLLLLIAAAVAALYFNIYGARDFVGQYIHEPITAVAVWFNPELADLETQIRRTNEARAAEMDARDAAIVSREDQVALREDEAAARELALTRREAALERREEQLNSRIENTIPMFRRDMTDEERADMESLARTYSQMPPDAAARILVELPDAMDAAVVLHFMAERSAGAILAAMEPEYAAMITEILLG